jgi:hypothetical protein
MLATSFSVYATAGVYPEQWPLPLTLAAVQQSQAASQMQRSTVTIQHAPTVIDPAPPHALTRKRSSASISGDAGTVCI